MKKNIKTKRINSFLLVVLLAISITALSATNVSAADVTLTTNTRAGLQDVITSSGSTQTIITITDNIVFDGTAITIPSGADITIRSGTGAGPAVTLTQTSGRHFSVAGSLKLEDIILDGSTEGTRETASGGGVQVNSSGKFYMNDGAVIQNCSATNGGGVYLSGGSSGLFTMESGALITGCFASTGTSNRGGGVYMLSGTLTMKDGAVIENCVSGDTGGGVYMTGSNSKFYMYGGTIRGNKTTKWSAWSSIGGGGVYAAGSSKFYMTGGIITANDVQGSNHGGGGVQVSGSIFDMSGDAKISENYVTASNGTGGGGIMLRSGATVNISGNAKVTGNVTTKANISGGGIAFFDPNPGTVNLSENAEISGNIAGNNGGGVYVPYGILNIIGGAIRDNRAIGTSTGNGGGIYISASASLTATGAVSITGNSAHTSGGAIYTADTAYSNITTNSSTVFSGNTASALYRPPINAADTYPNIGFSTVSMPGIVDHPINNYDINYTTGTQIVKYTITVQTEGNGTASASETAAYPGSQITLTATPGANYRFKEWQVVSGGVAIEDGKFTMPSNNVTIKAIFEEITFTVSFESNGGSPVHSQTVVYGGKVTQPEDPVKGVYTFAGWFTDNETFENLWDFENDTVTRNMTLYAKWTVNQYTVSFDANGGTPVGSQTVAYGGKVNKPEDPAKEGFTFAGWFIDNETFENAWDFENNTVEGNMTLYAKWTAVSEPNEPTEPEQPEYPSESGQSTEPTEPEQPEYPSESGQSTEPTDPNVPKTDDNNSIALWMLTFFISLTIMGFLITSRKKRKE